MTAQEKKTLSNAEKQQRYRERQKGSRKKELRGYLTPEALACYQEIQQKTEWSDSCDAQQCYSVDVCGSQTWTNRFTERLADRT